MHSWASGHWAVARVEGGVKGVRRVFESRSDRPDIFRRAPEILRYSTLIISSYLSIPLKSTHQLIKKWKILFQCWILNFPECKLIPLLSLIFDISQIWTVFDINKENEGQGGERRSGEARPRLVVPRPSPAAFASLPPPAQQHHPQKPASWWIIISSATTLRPEKR